MHNALAEVLKYILQIYSMPELWQQLYVCNCYTYVYRQGTGVAKGKIERNLSSVFNTRLINLRAVRTFNKN